MCGGGSVVRVQERYAATYTITLIGFIFFFPTQTGEDIVNNEFVGAEAATPVQAACTETSILR
jgi:hypothetical protein